MTNNELGSLVVIFFIYAIPVSLVITLISIFIFDVGE